MYTKQFYLSKNATEIVGFHEMAHFKHYEEVGEVYLTLSKLQKETYVWEQILANRSKWTKAELQDSLNYINSIREEQYGLEILEIARKVLEDFRKGRYKEDDIEKVVLILKKNFTEETIKVNLILLGQL